MSCTHHWLLAPQAIETDGTCKHCGETRHFDGAYVDAFDIAKNSWFFQSWDPAIHVAFQTKQQRGLAGNKALRLVAAGRK